MNRYICQDLSGVLTKRSITDLQILWDGMCRYCSKNTEYESYEPKKKDIFFRFMYTTVVLRRTGGFRASAESDYDYYRQLKGFLQRHLLVLTDTLKYHHLILFKHFIFCFLPIWYFIQ